MSRAASLLEGIPRELPVEVAEVLCRSDAVGIERIVSRGHASPPGFWYDQETDEFVLLVKGRAGLRLEGQEAEVTLEAGDWLEIKAHTRHRVEWTDPHGDTVWLAVHYR